MSAGILGQLPWTELLALALGLAGAGLAAGFVAGLLGVGGGVVLVPVLAEVLSVLGVAPELRVPVAVGTSLATVLPTAFVSVRGHDRKGAVDWALLKRWTGPTILGAVCGLVLARFLGGGGLAAVFGFGALTIALYLLFGRETWRLGSDPNARPVAWGFGLGNGTISALMGVGGGTFGVSILTLYGLAIHRAVGTAAGFGLIIGLPGAAGMAINGWGVTGLPPFSLGYVNLPGLLLIVPASMIATPWGVWAAHALSRKALRRAFAVFLILTSARMLWRAFA